MRPGKALNGTDGRPGRPTKRNKKLVAELLEAISLGAPFILACQSVGISSDIFCNWRRADPQFAQQIDQAAARGALKKLRKIEAHGEDNFAALSWMLERRFPDLFAKPEVALNVGIQNNLNAPTNGIDGLQSIIVSDLEFMRLREHESYQHRGAERPIHEVEAEVVVPPDLSGTLARTDYPGAVIVSETQAADTERRVNKSNARIDELLKAKRLPSITPKNGDSTPESQTAMKLATITWPNDKEPTAGWWAQLTCGDNTRAIERETATQVCRVILRETLGATRAQSMPIKFADGTLTLRDVHSALEDLVGPKGWQAILKKAGHV